jgi:D-alanyl-D-alanine carboxypeptidase (penicillin-binding protein 5/6)
VDGSVDAFVQEMNQTAKALGLADTRYTDPSGLDEATRSTAADQVRLADVAMREPGFAGLVATSKAQLPVVGTVRNTDTLLGTGGFVGIKTGSDDAAGGCFMFRTHRVIDGRSVEITGVVLGQPGRDLIAAGLAAAAQLADRVAPAS